MSQILTPSTQLKGLLHNLTWRKVGGPWLAIFASGIAEAPMQDFNKLMNDLKRTHDEIALKVHLGRKDLQDEWSNIEKRWHSFEKKAELAKSAKDVGDALKALGFELRTAFAKIRLAL